MDDLLKCLYYSNIQKDEQKCYSFIVRHTSDLHWYEFNRIITGIGNVEVNITEKEVDNFSHKYHQ